MTTGTNEVNELVQRLTVKQAVEAHGGPQGTAAGFKEAVDRGYVHLKFVGTQGGTDLGVRLDKGHTDLTGGDFAAGTGTVRVGGELTLNYENVRCHAVIDLATLKGEGWLEHLGPAEAWRGAKQAADRA
jgi:hypothetical protein